MKRFPRRLIGALAVMALVALVVPARAQNFEILDQRLDADRHGYTVIRVWGSHYDMGFAMGAAFAGDIVTAWTEIKEDFAAYYDLARTAVSTTSWLPDEISDELDGIMAGVQSVQSSDMDLIDLKALNSFSDLLYGACRSHSCWGSYVADPVKTLSTRRLDFSTPFDMALHHVLCAWDPDDGSPRWVNLAWPGYVTVITGVNQYGTLVSLHDYNSDTSWGPGRVTRSVATRMALTGAPDGPLSGHLDSAEQMLSGEEVVTGTFINYYAPEGHGGVFTCPSGDGCGTPRVPQNAYRSGEVLITTNSQTDGTTVPSGGSFMDDYYETGGPKDLESHFGLMGTSGLHLLSVEYRAEEDMTIWIHGRGRADRVEVEWSDLFPGSYPDGGSPDAESDAGTDAGSDAGEDAGMDAGTDAGSDAGEDAGTDAGSDAGADDPDTQTDQDNPSEEDGGCGCSSGDRPGTVWMLLFAVVLCRRRRDS